MHIVLKESNGPQCTVHKSTTHQIYAVHSRPGQVILECISPLFAFKQTYLICNAFMSLLVQKATARLQLSRLTHSIMHMSTVTESNCQIAVKQTYLFCSAQVLCYRKQILPVKKTYSFCTTRVLCYRKHLSDYD